MQNYLLQIDSGEIQQSLNETVSNVIDQITPELPHTTFVTDLAFIMIIGAIVTLAFFKIKQPLTTFDHRLSFCGNVDRSFISPLGLDTS
jgi:CPA2 family monovalent cation:H+ antiporter-2